MNKILGTSLAVAGSVLATLVSVSSAQAVTIATDGTWNTFGFAATGSTATPDYQFTLTSEGSLDVTDFQLVGDEFEIFNNGTSLGKTFSVVADPSQQNYGSGDDAWADNRFSKASFLLSAGSYNISISAFSSPYGGGSGYLRVQPVPVPAIIPGAILAGLYFGHSAIRRRKTLKTII